MAILATCWLIVESRVIPDGFLKWFFLSFYIHPAFLVPCQLFLWLKLLLQCLISLFSFPLTIISCTITIVSNSINGCRASESEHVESCSFSTTPVGIANRNSYFYSNKDDQKFVSDGVVDLKQPLYLDGFVQTLSLDQSLGVGSDDDDDVGSPMRDDEGVGGDGGGFFDSPPSSSPSVIDVGNGGFVDSPSSSPVEEEEEDELVEGFQSVDCSLSCTILAREITNNNYQQQEEDQEEEEEEVVCVDGAFYQMYLERMRWFDCLNHDRTSGLSALLNKQVELCNESPFEKIQLPEDFLSSPPNIASPLSKIDKKKLIKSMENDFELVFVAQSCLSWEALHHQYKKLEALFCQEDGSIGVLCCAHKVGQQFQKFEVLLERFMEDERCHGKRVWNYVRARFTLDNLLQVPQLSVTIDKEGGGEGTLQVKEVLNILERCIKTFWAFVMTDTIKKRPWWKLRSSLHSTSCLEDPRDLRLLYDLTKQFQKKDLCLRDLQGKRRCWLRKMESLVEEESERQEILFALIEMKLISRALQLPVITTCQLKWCHEKLDNIEFRDGKVVRSCPKDDAFLFFPP